MSVLQIKRGTTAEVAAYTPAVGEPVWDREGKVLRVGDGATAGGIDVTNYVSFARFGGSPTAVDNTAALQAAANYCTTTERTLFIPSGRYKFANNAATNFSFTGRLTMIGEGMDSSVFVYDDAAGTSRRDFFKGTATDFIMEGVGIEGTLGDNGDYTQRSHLLAVTFTGSCEISSCSFSKGRYMMVVVSGGRTANIHHNRLDKSVADGIRPTNVQRVHIHSNVLHSINDDCIAVHVTDSLPYPVDRTVQIYNNIAVDCQGITVLGMKQGGIYNNTLIRPHTRGILVGCTDDPSGASVEGNTPPVGFRISGNTISDLFPGSVFSGASATGLGWIVVRNTAPKAGSAPGYVGGPNGSGGIVTPYNYLYLNDIDASGVPNPGNWWLTISGNQCERTLGPVTNYTDYGFGSRFGRSGPTNQAITQANFDSVGKQIRIMGQAQDLLVDSNLLTGGSIPISFDGVSGGGYLTWRNCIARGNLLSNWSGNSGIFIGGDGYVIVESNLFDGDPFCVHSARLPNGKWNSGLYTTYSAIWLSAARAVIKNNVFKNVGAVFQGATIDRAWWDGNVLACNPIGINYNANNIGIGDIATPHRLGAAVLIEDGDPASATFGQRLDGQLKAATAMPTAGKYVQGHTVINASPTVAGAVLSQYIITGWVRMTTGSAHVLNTDWRELRNLTGT